MIVLRWTAIENVRHGEGLFWGLIAGNDYAALFRFKDGKWIKTPTHLATTGSQAVKLPEAGEKEEGCECGVPECDGESYPLHNERFRCRLLGML